MPELRHDPLSGRRVVVAPERAARPHTTGERDCDAPPAVAHDPSCPFCPGNEHETPPEVARLGGGAADAPGWTARVFPNKYPIVGEGVRGVHEVVALSPAHDRDLAQLEPDHARAVMRLVRDRAALHLARGLAHAGPFVNHLRGAGASIAHPHAQLVVLDFVPPAVHDAARRFVAAGIDLVTASLDDAYARGLVVVDGDAPAWIPSTATTPYETIVAHPDAGPWFADASDDHVDAVTDAITAALRLLCGHLGNVPYNVVLHGAPGGHWYARIAVRTFVHAGFEMGTDVLANPVPGEIAAARLREPA